MPNVKLLNDAISLCEANPKHYNQEVAWHEDDFHCIGGVIELIVNNLPINTNFDESDLDDSDTFNIVVKHLEIDEVSARVLFYVENDLQTIKEYSKILEQDGELFNKEKGLYVDKVKELILEKGYLI